MSWRNALSMLVVVSIIALLGFGLTRNADDVPSPLVGEAAPSFELSPLDGGGPVSLTGLRGTPVIVNFWASWCLACIQEHPTLIRAWRKYRDQGIELVGVVYQDTPENARRYITERGGGWTQLLDPKTRTAIDFGVYGVPETFFIDRQGLITHKHIGPVTDAVMDTQIQALLDGAGAAEADAADSVPGEELVP